MNAQVRIIDTPERVRLTVEDFLLLNGAGAFDGYTRSELIDGDIYVMNAQFSPHARAHSRMLVALAAKLAELGSDYEALVEVSIYAARDSMPEPDIAVTAFRGEGAVPPEAIALIVEVSSTTRHVDLGRKAAIYAAAGVPEYWVVDLPMKSVRQHSGPASAVYQVVSDVPFGLTLEAVTLPGLRIDTGMLID